METWQTKETTHNGSVPRRTQNRRAWSKLLIQNNNYFQTADRNTPSLSLLSSQGWKVIDCLTKPLRSNHWTSKPPQVAATRPQVTQPLWQIEANGAWFQAYKLETTSCPRRECKQQVSTLERQTTEWGLRIRNAKSQTNTLAWPKVHKNCLLRPANQIK